MLLTMLSRKEKLKFMDLSLHMVAVDGAPSDLESRMLSMQIAEVGEGIALEYTFSLSQDRNETITFFKDSTVMVRNIVYLNLLRITMSDEFYNTVEHHLLEEVRDAFMIPIEKKRELMRVIYSERDLRERARRICSR
ncbi:MAG: hypothetical protein K9K93_00625 [Acholeplasmataceae bacterium]|nr:hypothetical protein [Acholeplasmataceae bacterium]